MLPSIHIHGILGQAVSRDIIMNSHCSAVMWGFPFVHQPLKQSRIAAHTRFHPRRFVRFALSARHDALDPMATIHDTVAGEPLAAGDEEHRMSSGWCGWFPQTVESQHGQ